MNVRKHMPSVIVVVLVWFAFAPSAHAELTNANTVNSMLQQFQSASIGWTLAIGAAADHLFWILAGISFVVMFGFLAVSGTNLGELAAALVRFILFTGIAYWVLDHGPEFSHTIIDSFTQVGARAAGTGETFAPTRFLDVSFSLYKKIIDQEHWYQPSAAVSAEIIGILTVLCACWMTANIILVLCSSWMLSSAGVIFLALGASVWGREMALNFWRTVIAVGVRVMVMILVMNLGYRFLQQSVALLTVSPNGGELVVFLAGSFLLALLSHSLPNLVASIVGGHGAHGIGNLGMGVGIGAALATSAVVENAASQVKRVAKAGASTVSEAIRSGEASVSNGNGQRMNGNRTNHP